jgi:TIR domain
VPQSEKTASLLLAELTRLRRDFDTHASRYPDETLTVYFIEAGVDPPPDEFRKPNHTVVLFQYMGRMASKEDVERIARARITKFGLNESEFAIFAAVEGPETELFRRMAARAGSVVPVEVRDAIDATMRARWDEVSTQGKPVFARNRDAVAVWLNLVLSCIANFQPNRFRGPRLAVDPFTASIPACEYLLGHINSKHAEPVGARSVLDGARFEVALSFPGEKRQFVANVAEGLKSAGVSVFYDHYYEADLAVPDLDLVLQRVYHDQSDLIAVFLCQEYHDKDWCGLEWRALRDLIKTRRGDSLMPFRFDDTAVPGLFSIDGYVDVRNLTPAETVELILTRLRRNSSA